MESLELVHVRSLGGPADTEALLLIRLGDLQRIRLASVP